jgi:hypothetical protein
MPREASPIGGLDGEALELGDFVGEPDNAAPARVQPRRFGEHPPLYLEV